MAKRRFINRVALSFRNRPSLPNSFSAPKHETYFYYYQQVAYCNYTSLYTVNNYFIKYNLLL